MNRKNFWDVPTAPRAIQTPSGRTEGCETPPELFWGHILWLLGTLALGPDPQQSRDPQAAAWGLFGVTKLHPKTPSPSFGPHLDTSG